MNMKPFSRSERVSGLIQKVLSDLLRKGISDPRLENVTITGVKMGPDLKTAYVYFSTYLGNKENDDITSGFQSAKGYVKRHLAGKLGLRYMPELKFFYDTSFDYGMKIEKLLKSVAPENETDHSTTEE
ncbi:MAG: 30S ribosome-binding factor RbfA [Desulfobacterales bacterium]|nr:30S ribosome-binding factor RbfA [Desulfobacterales bacterium]MDX2512650.1 30S ribosome-binding factor RbfA [Desulfobacterales bacterium]